MDTPTPRSTPATTPNSTSGPGTAPVGIDPERYARRWWTLVVLCLSLVLIVAGNSSLNVALPTIVREIDASQTQLQWIVDAYALVFAGLLLPAGALGDRFGRKGALQLGLVVFALGAVAASFATSPVQVIAFRAVMGVGAAFVMPSTLSLLSSVFPPAERARAIAIWAGFAGAGAAIGPIVSGLLLERFWFGSVFFVNLPIVVVALLAGAWLVPTSRDDSRSPLDVPGALLSVVGLGGVLFGIIEGPEQGWTSAPVLVGFVVGALGLVAFARRERSTAHPMLDLGWFRDRRFAIGATTLSLAFFAFFGLFFILTQYLQFVLGYSPLEAGLATLPMAFGLVLSAPRSATLVERFGPRRVVAPALLVAAAAFGLMSQFDPSTPYWQIMIALLLFGVAGGNIMAPSTGQIMSAMPLNKAGVGSAVNDATREVGGAVGIAVLGSVLTALYRNNVGEVLAGAPAQVAELARSSVGAGLAVAQQAPDPAAAAALVRTAFTDATAWAFLGAVVVSLANAAIVWRWGPRRSSFDEVGQPVAVAPAEA